jgi:hypothetical protein
MGSATYTSEREVSLKTHWYTPASDSSNMKERVVLRPPLTPTVFMGVSLTGTPSFNHVTVGGVKLMTSSSTKPVSY